MLPIPSHFLGVYMQFPENAIFDGDIFVLIYIY